MPIEVLRIARPRHNRAVKVGFATGEVVRNLMPPFAQTTGGPLGIAPGLTRDFPLPFRFVDAPFYPRQSGLFTGRQTVREGKPERAQWGWNPVVKKRHRLLRFGRYVGSSDSRHCIVRSSRRIMPTVLEWADRPAGPALLREGEAGSGGGIRTPGRVIMIHLLYP